MRIAKLHKTQPKYAQCTFLFTLPTRHGPEILKKFLPVLNLLIAFAGAYKIHFFNLRLDLGPHDPIPDTFATQSQIAFHMSNSTVSRAQIRSIGINNPAETPPDRWVHHIARYEYVMEMAFTDQPRLNIWEEEDEARGGVEGKEEEGAEGAAAAAVKDDYDDGDSSFSSSDDDNEKANKLNIKVAEVTEDAEVEELIDMK